MIWKKQPVGSKLADLQNNKANKDTATQSAAGLMSASDKTKLDGVATGATAVSVVNNLNSDSTTSALSAAQGKALNSKIEPIVVLSTETVASKCTRSAPIEIKPGATGAPRSGYGYIGYCSYGGTSFRHVIVSEYSTGNLFFSFGSNIGTTWYQLSYSPYNP